MATSATTSEEISVGAGDVFYRQSSPVGSWTDVGATQDDNVWRLTQEFTTPQFNGVVGPIDLTDYLRSELCELEVTIPQMSATLSGIIIPTAESSGGAAIAAVGGGAAGDLDAAITAGQWLAIKVSSVTGLAVGDYIQVGPSGSKETRQVTRVGTVGAGGTGIDVDFPFVLDHADTESYIEVDGDGTTVITGIEQRRIPSTKYQDWRLDVPGIDGRVTRFLVYNALALGDKEFSASDDDNQKPRVTITGRRSRSTPRRSAWDIIKVPVAQ